MNTTFARKILMLFTMKYKIELKSQIDAIGFTLQALK